MRPPAEKAGRAPDRHEVGSSEIRTADEELQRLQQLLDDAMNRLAGAFGTLAEDASARKHEHARDALVSTLQYHDICTQLLSHARSRLNSGLNIMEGGLPAEAAVRGCGPVLQSDMVTGMVELF